LVLDEYVRIHRRSCVYFFGQSQHICGIIRPLFHPPFRQLPDEFLLIVSVIDTIYGVGWHIRTTLAQRRGPEGTG